MSTRAALSCTLSGNCRSRWRYGQPGLSPKLQSYFCRVDADLPPPRGFVAGAVDLAMVSSAQRHGELITDLAAGCAVLCEAQVMRVQRLAAAIQAGLCCATHLTRHRPRAWNNEGGDWHHNWVGALSAGQAFSDLPHRMAGNLKPSNKMRPASEPSRDGDPPQCGDVTGSDRDRCDDFWWVQRPTDDRDRPGFAATVRRRWGDDIDWPEQWQNSAQPTRSEATKPEADQNGGPETEPE